MSVRLSPATKGLAFTKAAISLVLNQGRPALAAGDAEHRWPGDPVVAACLKAAQAAGSTSDPAWGGALVSYGLAGDFLEALRYRTVIDRLANVRRVPFEIDLPRETGAATAGWVGEGKARPVSRSTFDTLRMSRYTSAALVVLSKELVKSGKPGTVEGMHDLMLSTTAEFLDQQFLDPNAAAVAGVSPGSITNGQTRITSTGTTAAHAQADLPNVVDAVTSRFGAPIWIMTPRTCAQFAAWGFEGVKINGGTLFGIPILCSQSARPVGSPSSNLIVLVDAPEILLADEGRAEVHASAHSTIEMDDAPTADALDGTAGSASLVSMFQSNSVALRVQREISWARAHSGAVAFMEVGY